MKSIVADNLSNIIKEKCLKQCTVAQKAGYSKQQLTDMLKGRKRIKETDILRLASALDVDVSVLLKTEAGDSKQSDEAGDKQREKERPDVRAFVKLLKIEDGYAVCDVRFKLVKLPRFKIRMQSDRRIKCNSILQFIKIFRCC